MHTLVCLLLILHKHHNFHIFDLIIACSDILKVIVHQPEKFRLYAQFRPKKRRFLEFALDAYDQKKSCYASFCEKSM